MIAIDTNILVYAHRRDSAFHAPAARAVRRLAEGRAPWMLPWVCVHEFLAIATHPRIYSPASTMEQATAQVEAWMESPSVVLEGESAGHWGVLRDCLLKGRVAGPMVHDGRVAAICIAHEVACLWTSERDFSRFPRLRTVNPLADPALSG